MDAFQSLLTLMARLRAPDGCPWDREQTLASLVPYTIEESHELIASIEAQDWSGLKEELGDLLFHIVFYCQIASEQGLFSVDDVAQGAVDKMQRRHPHIFGLADRPVSWQAAKQQERRDQAPDSAWDQGIPPSLPALLWAYKLQHRARDLGFEWKHSAPVWEKLFEEIAELQQAVAQQDQQAIADEFGDVLFSLVNLAPFLQVHPEQALRQACVKFRERLSMVCTQAVDQQLDLSSLDEAALDRLWQSAKAKIVLGRPPLHEVGPANSG